MSTWNIIQLVLLSSQIRKVPTMARPVAQTASHKSQYLINFRTNLRKSSSSGRERPQLTGEAHLVSLCLRSRQ
jgi:hypothetical protein